MDSASYFGLSVQISLSLAYIDYGSLTVTTVPPIQRSYYSACVLLFWVFLAALKAAGFHFLNNINCCTNNCLSLVFPAAVAIQLNLTASLVAPLHHCMLLFSSTSNSSCRCCRFCTHFTGYFWGGVQKKEVKKGKIVVTDVQVSNAACIWYIIINSIKSIAWITGSSTRICSLSFVVIKCSKQLLYVQWHPHFLQGNVHGSVSW